MTVMYTDATRAALLAAAPRPAVLPSVRALACAFLRYVERSVTAAELREIRRINARSTHPDACATSDFFDANMAMDAAFCEFGIDLDTDNEAHCARWNDAWSYARRRFLGGRK